MNSARVFSVLNSPVNAEVVAIECCFWMPRMTMHMCCASITTATPSGFERLLDAVADLDRQPLLHLQPAREGIDHARDLGQADDVAVRECRRRAPCRRTAACGARTANRPRCRARSPSAGIPRGTSPSAGSPPDRDRSRGSGTAAPWPRAPASSPDLRASGPRRGPAESTRYLLGDARDRRRVVLVDLRVAVHLVFFEHLGLRAHCIHPLTPDGRRRRAGSLPRASGKARTDALEDAVRRRDRIRVSWIAGSP